MISTLCLVVGEIGADGRYAVCTNLPRLMIGRWGMVFHDHPVFLGLVSPSYIACILEPTAAFCHAVSSDLIRGQVLNPSWLGVV